MSCSACQLQRVKALDPAGNAGEEDLCQEALGHFRWRVLVEVEVVSSCEATWSF